MRNLFLSESRIVIVGVVVLVVVAVRQLIVFTMLALLLFCRLQ